VNRTQTVKTAVLAIAIAAGTVGAQPAVAQQPQADLPKDMTGDTKVIVLSKSDLPGGMEATTFMTEIPPGSSTQRHYHPGQDLA
jgi:quercetin dioxygenase-like cupin family protein